MAEPCEVYAAVELSRRIGTRLIEDVRLHATSDQASRDADMAADDHRVVSVHKVALPEPAVDTGAAMDRWCRAHDGKLRLLTRVAEQVDRLVREGRDTTVRDDLLAQFYALHSMLPQLYMAFQVWPQTAEARARAAAQEPAF